MELIVVLGIVFELAAAAFCVWGILHEDRLIRFERALVGAVIWTLWERLANAEFGIRDAELIREHAGDRIRSIKK